MTDELKQTFIKLGYKELEYTKILNTYPIYKSSDDALVEKAKIIYDFFISIGCSKEDIIKI